MITIFIYLFAIILVFIILFFLFWKFIFLRDPEMKIPKGKVIVSPASGKIIKIMEINKKNELKIDKGLFGKIYTLCSDVSDSCYLISIFMSPFNVHIQRASYSGKVISVKHKLGSLKFSGSFENGITNEKTETLINSKEIGRFKIIQIAGCVVRRIQNWAKKDQMLEKGERIGLINYGSQVSLILPKKNVDITAIVGMKVEAGESIIAKVKNV